MTKGYFGVGIYNPKKYENIGTLWRTAHIFGAKFLFTVGARYKRQASDTTNATKHIPIFEYLTWEDFVKETTEQIICIEIDEKAQDLRSFQHPEQAVYVLGAEDYGIPQEYLRQYPSVKITGGKFCLNVSVAGSLVIYDRISKVR